MSETIQRGHHSASDLLRHYSQMGIPHFQRGLVWDTGPMALLLESMYYDTPCGSILLWKPDDARRHGIPLGDAPERLRYLVVDGQQRIRSLHNILCHDEADKPSEVGDSAEPAAPEGSPEANEGDARPSVWCVNLARLPEFRDDFKIQERFRLFGLHADPLIPADTDAKQAHRRALVPLRWFLDRWFSPDKLRFDARGRPVEAAVGVLLKQRSVMERLGRLPETPLFDVRVMESGQSLAEIVSAYNRINSAGKRVEAEERAFASLVSVHGATETQLRAFFRQTQRSEPGENQGPLEARDDLVQREKESRFGFKLFMRVFVIAFTYHTNRSLGSSAFSFRAVDLRRLEEARQHLDHILTSTIKTLSSMAQILRTHLYCDDFRTLPDTSSLWPIFQCLIRFPGLATSGDQHLAAASLRLMLADLADRDLLQLVERINDAQTSAQALGVFDNPVLKRRTAKAARDGLLRAQSLTDRYTLVLYWLLRRRGAKDFSYDANLTSERAEKLREKYATFMRDGSTEPAIASSYQLKPQKQHLVPYGLLKEMYSLSGARPGKHEAHDIGNLTYISEGLNGLDALGSKPLRLQHEPPANRDAHLLDTPEILRAFSQACQTANGKGSRWKRAYREFCRRRRDVIAEQLTNWEREMWEGVSGETPGEQPAKRLMDRTSKGRVRSLPCSRHLIERLIGLIEQGVKERKNKQEDDLCLVFMAAENVKPNGSKTRTAFRLDVAANGSTLRVKISDAALAEGLKQDQPQVQWKVSKKSLVGTFHLQGDAATRDAEAAVGWLENWVTRRK